MATTTKKQKQLAARIKKLKKQHDVLSRKKRVIQKRLNREDATKQRQLTKLDKVISKAQNAWDRLEDKPLPSAKKSRQLTDQLYKLEEKIRLAEAARFFKPVPANEPVEEE